MRVRKVPPKSKIGQLRLKAVKAKSGKRKTRTTKPRASKRRAAAAWPGILGQLFG